MDSLTFISKLVDSLAWPIVALVLGLFFRKELVTLVSTLRRLKAGPLEAEFEMATKQALANAEAVKPPRQTVAITLQTETQRSSAQQVVAKLREARSDPARAILEGWAMVDGELFRLGLQTGLIVDPLENTGKVYQTVLSAGVLPIQTSSLVKELRELRNRVAHVEVHPTAEAAQDYLLAVDRAVELILNCRRSLPSYTDK